MAETNVMETLSQAADELNLRRLAEYRAVVADVAAGKSLDPGAVLAAIEAVEKTFAEFEGDVDRRRQRVEQAKQLEKLPQAISERDKLVRQVATLEAEFAKVREAHQAKVEPLAWKIDALEKRITAAESIRHILAENCTDPVRLAKKKAFDQKHREVVDLRDQARATVQSKKSTIDAARAAIASADRNYSLGNRPSTATLEARIETFTKQMEAAKAEARKYEAELAELEAQEKDLINELAQL